jgi:4-hydroxy-3-methylbut-2-enyl diphosphate reductase
MEVIIAKNTGLCYGVMRAVRIAQETRKQKRGKVQTFGDLIHNPRVIADLKAKGIYSVSNIHEIKDGTVIIRSHGISPEIYRLILNKKVEVVDATCPIVKKIQRLVESLSKKEKEVVIVGNKDHPEIEGLIGHSHTNAIIVEDESQAKGLPKKRKRAVLAQSTQDIHLFSKVVGILVEKTRELTVHNTICQSTQTRQKSTLELASGVDVLFIIGGKNSSNTYKLYKNSRNILSNTYFIESAEQITPEMLSGAEKIGLSGGASTPPEAIQEAALRIKSNLKHQCHREKMVQCQN